jgi:[ribosomal protein S18]-alanine N-acetyltransferase
VTSALRRAGSADFASIAALERRCFGQADGIFSPRQLRALLANPNAYWLVGASGCAMACWLTARNGHARWARLYSLAVDPVLRGQGWGGRLLAAGEAWMRQQGLTTCRAEVKVENHHARRLYASHGYHEAGILPDYYGAGLDGVRLVKQLEATHPARRLRKR